MRVSIQSPGKNVCVVVVDHHTYIDTNNISSVFASPLTVFKKHHNNKDISIFFYRNFFFFLRDFCGDFAFKFGKIY